PRQGAVVPRRLRLQPARHRRRLDPRLRGGGRGQPGRPVPRQPGLRLGAVPRHAGLLQPLLQRRALPEQPAALRGGGDRRRRRHADGLLPVTTPAAPPAPGGLGRRAGWALALVATATMAVSYIDRQTLSVLAPTITRALDVSDHA